MVERYTFVSHTSFSNGKFTIHYIKDGKILTKSLPYRTTPDQLMFVIERIKKDIGYKEDELVRERSSTLTDNKPIFKTL